MILKTKLDYLIRLDLIYHLMINSATLTLLLLFIDEGKYNFSLTYDSGTWGALVIYFGIILALQLLIFKLMLNRYEYVGKIFAFLSITSSMLVMVYLGLLLK